MNPPAIQKIDAELLALYAELRATTNPVLQHRLLQKIDQLLDQRNLLTA
jgi:hypothetical protein